MRNIKKVNRNKNYRSHKIIRIRKRKFPLSAIVLLPLLALTFLTVYVAGQQQFNRSKAQQPTEQACIPGAPLTEENAGTIVPFCTQFPDAESCKTLCQQTETNINKPDLCQPGGVYHCEAAAGQPEKGKCQQGPCTTSEMTGTSTYCGGGGTCCKPRQALNGDCTKDPDCVEGLVCTANKCAAPAPKGPAQDLDADGKQNDQDDDVDGDGIPDEQDPDRDNDGIPNAQDDQPEGAPGAVPAPPAPGGGGAPAPGGGGAPNPGGGGTQPKATCASVKGTCKLRSSCTGTVKPGLCPGGTNNVCCVGGSGGGGDTTRCTSDAQCKAKNGTWVCQNGTCRAPAKKLNGAQCSSNAECTSNRCSIWGRDTVKRCGPIKAI